MAVNENKTPLVRVEHLKKYFDVRGKGILHAVDDISFDIYPQETLGLVGESGCGKSTVGNVVTRLLDATDGKVYLGGKELTQAKSSELHELRKEIQIVFQDPYSSINPRKSVRTILEEPYRIHKLAKGEALNKMVDELAETTGIEQYVLKKYPHELDGGKRQLVGIARALALNPKFIVCDEPVSALDVSIQATIINLLIDLQQKRGLTYLFISHDLSVVRHISNRVAVMYLGQMVELADTDTLFLNPLHPYTIALLSAVPKVEFKDKKERIVLAGDVPSPLNPKQEGCRFAPRCWMACDECSKLTPEFREVEPGHFVSCPYWEKAKLVGAERLSIPKT
ncbi:MAG: ABC transporter ATP-binding protein [Oscillospiraceae bacterium]